MSSNQLPSADVLRTSLTALNLPVWGTRDQMWERLKNGGEKKKPGPKPGKKKKDAGGVTLSATNANAMFEPSELKFYNAERPKLLALGISDHAKLTTELKRRWEESKTKTKTTSKNETKGGSGQTFMSDTVISAVDMTSAGLKLVGVDSSSGHNKYIYEIVPKTSTGRGASASASSDKKKKRKKEESSDDDSGDSDDSEMDRCEDIVAQRFRKMPKSLLKENLKI